MALRDDIDHRLIEAHQASSYGKISAPSQVMVIPDISPQTLGLAVQHLLYITAALERIVKHLAERIEQIPD